MSLPHILVFDSGVGGLSIIDEIRCQLPHCSLTYASDNAFFPYGTKGEDELVERVHRVLEACFQDSRPDIIVVACNTASTVALPRIREHFQQDHPKLEIVGVVPAIKPAASLSKSKVIGLLATPGTVKRAYTQQLIADFASDCRIIPVGSSELVQIAEKKLRREAIDLEQIRSILSPFFSHLSGKTTQEGKQLDSIVLACTHFPLLQPELQQCVPHPVQWVDSGDAIARRVKDLLQQHGLPSDPSSSDKLPHFHSLFTQQSSEVNALLPTLQNFVPGEVGYLSVSSL